MSIKLKQFAAVTFMVVMLSACGGRTANPILMQQVGDDRKSCQALTTEMAQIQGEIQRLTPQTEKAGKNVALGVAGAFLLVPWFFMDLGNAEQTEVEAYRQRYNHLLIVATDKQCDLKQQPANALTIPIESSNTPIP